MSKVSYVLVGLLASLALTGSAFAGHPGPEIDPRMATGGLTILGVGVVLLIERYRARK
jgi:hypothetical protein